MEGRGFIYKVFNLYYDGFKNMTLGKTLWAIILVKLIVIFLVIKLFFLPDFLSSRAKEGNKAAFVSEEIINRASDDVINHK